MNRFICALTILSMLFCGCATNKEISAAQEQIVKSAIGNTIETAHRYVTEVDDGTSDASTVALALALRCRREYDSLIKLEADTLLANNEQRIMFKQRKNTASSRIEFFLPIVMQYRVRQSISTRRNQIEQ